MLHISSIEENLELLRANPQTLGNICHTIPIRSRHFPGQENDGYVWELYGICFQGSEDLPSEVLNFLLYC